LVNTRAFLDFAGLRDLADLPLGSEADKSGATSKLPRRGMNSPKARTSRGTVATVRRYVDQFGERSAAHQAAVKRRLPGP
jgi:hypothetical protein